MLYNPGAVIVICLLLLMLEKRSEQ